MINSLDTEAQNKIIEHGIETIKCDRALPILETILTQSINQVAVFPVNWEKFLQRKPHNNLYERLKSESKTVATPRSKFLQHLRTIKDRDRITILLEHIRTQLAKVLGFSDPEYIDIEENFSDLGMDSLMAVQFKNQLQTSLDNTIPLYLIFDNPTVQSLSNYQSSIISHQLSVISYQLSVNNHPSTTNHPPLTTNQQPKEIKPEHYQFILLPEYLNIKQDLERLKTMGNPFFTVHEGIAKDTTIIHGKQLINYSHYNYIGMSGAPIVTQSAQDAVAKYGTSVSASRVVSGEKPIHWELETEIANFIGTEDCIVYIGGHATNVTTIGHIFGEKDLIICDFLSHNSIQEGCKLSNATKMEFPHNDYQQLETIL